MAYIPTIATSPQKLPSFTELVGTLPFTNEPLSSMPTMGTNTPVAPQLTTPPSSAKAVPSSDCDNILSTSPLAFLRPIITKSTSNGYFLHQLQLYSKTLCASFKANSTSSSLPSPKSMASTPSSPSEYNNNYIPVHVHLNITMTPMPGYSMPGAPPTLAPPMVFHQLQPQHQHHPLQQLPITQAAHVMHSSPHTMIHQHNTPLMTYDTSLMMANISNASTESLNYIKATNEDSKHIVGSYTSMVPLEKKLIFHTRGKESKRRYICKVCSRPFTTSGHLARHNRIHTGERRHQCPWPTCSAKFARQDNCMQHYKTHVNGKRRSRKCIDGIEEGEVSSDSELPQS